MHSTCNYKNLQLITKFIKHRGVKIAPFVYCIRKRSCLLTHRHSSKHVMDAPPTITPSLILFEQSWRCETDSEFMHPLRFARNGNATCKKILEFLLIFVPAFSDTALKKKNPIYYTASF
jgi:hypothetical protein